MLTPSENADDLAGSAELASLLGSLTSEGQVSSSGVFTIDVRAALPKLEKFQLPKPHFGLLKVIQSAVGSGATYVDADFGSSGITIEHDGQPPTPEQLRDLLSYLLATDQVSGNRSLRDLAIGVNTSLARGASWVEVSVRAELGWVSQRWETRESSSQTEQLAEQGSKANVRFVLRRTMGQAASEVWGWANKDMAGLFTGSRDVLDEDARALFDCCRNAPAQVKINGRPVPPHAMGRRVVRRWSPLKVVEHRRANAVEIIIEAAYPSPHLMSAPRASQARSQFVMPGDFDGRTFRSQGVLLPAAGRQLQPHRCFAVIGIRDRAQVPGEMTLVKDGVDLTRLTPRDLPQGVSVVLAAEGLRLDLSGFRIVESDEMKERLRWLGHVISQSAATILSTFPELEWSQQESSHLQSLAQLAPDVG